MRATESKRARESKSKRDGDGEKARVRDLFAVSSHGSIAMTKCAVSSQDNNSDVPTKSNRGF